MTMVALLPMSEPPTSARGRHRHVAFYPANDGETNVIALDGFRDAGTVASPPRVLLVDRTSSGPVTAACIPTGQSTAEVVLELRRRSGLTWELLSELFNVSRRTVHHWANGRAPSAQHEREIRLTLNAIRHLDEGDCRATRDRLLSITNGLTLFDLLVERRYADVMCQPKGAAPKIAGRRVTALSEDEWARRQPPPPAILLDTITDQPELPVGKVRIVRPAVRKKKPTE